MKVSASIEENISSAKEIFPIGKSFDIITRELYLGKTKAFWIGINGFCKTEILQQLFSDLQNPLYMKDDVVENIENYMNAKIGYAQLTLTDDWDKIIQDTLSGPSVLFIDNSDRAIIIDARNYPVRSISEPETEKVTRGSRDGFVETVLFNTNLIRRRIRSPKLTFEIQTVGSAGKSDVAIAYMQGSINDELLEKLRKSLSALNITSLTMGSRSLDELLIKKKWYCPLPSIQITERPDVACSYLLEGHILVLVDNSPSVLILPCTIFQFTQSPEDYYKSPSVGNYFRTVRFLCIPISIFLMPVFLLLTAYFPDITERWQLLAATGTGPAYIIFYVFAVEFILDLFKYSSSHSSDRFSGSLALIGGLIIGDIAVELNWASTEVLFYAALTLLTSLSISSIEFADALRIYRIFLVIATAVFGLSGFIAGTALCIFSVCATPTFAGMSYFWPLYPFNRDALKTLLFRYPTAAAQPSAVWKRERSAK